MIYIDINKLNIDDDWKTKSTQLTNDMIANLGSVKSVFTIIDKNDTLTNFRVVDFIDVGDSIIKRKSEALIRIVK